MHSIYFSITTLFLSLSWVAAADNSDQPKASGDGVVIKNIIKIDSRNAQKRKAPQEMASVKKIKKEENPALRGNENIFDMLPNEIIILILNFADSEKNHASFSFVNKGLFKIFNLENYYAEQNKNAGHLPWRSTGGKITQQRTLYFFNVNFHTLLGLYTDIKCYNFTAEIDKIRFERIYNKIMMAPFFDIKDIPKAYATFLHKDRHHPCFESPYPNQEDIECQKAKLEVYHFFTADQETHLGSPNECAIANHFFCCVESKPLLYKFAPIYCTIKDKHERCSLFDLTSEQILSLKRHLCLGRSELSAARFVESWDQLINLEPIPSIYQLSSAQNSNLSAAEEAHKAGNKTKAVEFNKKAARYSQMINDHYEKAAEHSDRRIYCRDQSIQGLVLSDYDLAAKASAIAGGKHSAEKNPVKAVHFYENAAKFYEAKVDYLAAIDRYPEPLDYRNVATANSTAGHIYFEHRNYEKAVGFYINAAKFYELDLKYLFLFFNTPGIDNCQDVADANFKAGDTVSKIGNRDKAAQLFEKAADYYQLKIDCLKKAQLRPDAHDFGNIAVANYNAAIIANNAGNSTKALDHFEKAAEYYEMTLNSLFAFSEIVTAVNFKNVATANFNAAFIVFNAGDSTKAAQLYEKAADYYEKLITFFQVHNQLPTAADYTNVVKTYSYASKSYAKAGNRAKAAECFKKTQMYIMN